MTFICADDYGLTKFSDKHIAECADVGALNKISIFPNCEYEELKKMADRRDINLSIHLNLVEGKPMADPEKVKLLLDEDGNFKYSFIGLFFLSLSSKRKAIEKQIYEEVKTQLTFFRSVMGFDAPLMIDSHQHTHMIPMVFRAVMKTIRREKIDVGYLRIPAEPVKPYLKEPTLYLTYKPANIIKQWLLNILWQINKSDFKRRKIPTALFMGVLFSGHMDEKRVKKILPHYEALAEERGMDIEILFHPGYIDLKDTYKVIMRKNFKNFYLSKGRKIEYDTIMNLKNN